MPPRIKQPALFILEDQVDRCHEDLLRMTRKKLSDFPTSDQLKDYLKKLKAAKKEFTEQSQSLSRRMLKNGVKHQADEVTDTRHQANEEVSQYIMGAN